MIELVISGLARVGAVTIPVNGDSMLPTLRPGEKVVLHPVEPENIHQDDIVAYRFRDGRLVLHRVHTVMTDQVITMGDNLHFFDPPVWKTDIIGVARDIAPRSAPRAAPPPWPAQPQPTIADIWLVGGAADRAAPDTCVVPASWRLHVRPTEGGDVSAALLEELRAAATGRLCIGVSEHAVHNASEVLNGGLPPHAQVLIGCSFGRSRDPRTSHLLPSAIADVHVRLGPPLTRLTPTEALRRLAALVMSDGRP